MSAWMAKLSSSVIPSGSPLRGLVHSTSQINARLNIKQPDDTSHLDLGHCFIIFVVFREGLVLNGLVIQLLFRRYDNSPDGSEVQRATVRLAIHDRGLNLLYNCIGLRMGNFGEYRTTRSRLITAKRYINNLYTTHERRNLGSPCPRTQVRSSI